MGIGLGIVLLLAGLVLALDVVSYDLPGVQDDALGLVLMAVGAVAIVLALVMSSMRTRNSTTVEEHRFDHRV